MKQPNVLIVIAWVAISITLFGCFKPVAKLKPDGTLEKVSPLDSNDSISKMDGKTIYGTDIIGGDPDRMLFDSHIYLVKAGGDMVSFCHDPDCPCFKKSNLEHPER